MRGGVYLPSNFCSSGTATFVGSARRHGDADGHDPDPVRRRGDRLSARRACPPPSSVSRARRKVVVVVARRPREAPATQMHDFLSRDGLLPSELLAVGQAGSSCGQAAGGGTCGPRPSDAGEGGRTAPTNHDQLTREPDPAPFAPLVESSPIETRLTVHLRVLALAVNRRGHSPSATTLGLSGRAPAPPRHGSE